MKLKFFTQSEWAEVRRFPHHDWQAEVANGDTRLGYMRWVVGQCESNGIDYTLADEADLGSEDFPRAPMEGEDYDNWCDEVENLDTRQGLDAWVFERHAGPAFEQEAELDQATAAAPRTPHNRVGAPRL